MIFEEMFESAKAALLKATVEDAAAWAAMQVSVTGDGSGIFYVKVSDGALDVQPYDYRDHDVALTVDSADLLNALTKKKTETLELIGDDDKVAIVRTVLSTIPATRKRRTTAAADDKPAAKAPAKSTGRCCKKPAAAKTASTAAKTAAAKTTAAKTVTAKAETAAKSTATAAKTAAKTEKTVEA